MKRVLIGKKGFSAPCVVQGCMRIAELSAPLVEKLVRTDLECGIDFFDHADIYGKGRCEELFGELLKNTPSLRDKMQIQTKCGIAGGLYDFSKKHILESVDRSLKRLCCDHIDFLLLHRPDALFEPSEVAEAFSELQSCGKVQNFGVSNQNPMQMELLCTEVKQELCVNQLQLSVARTGLIDAGFNVNTTFEGGLDRDGQILDYCRIKGCTVQAWSPFQYGFFEGVFLGSPKYAELNRVIERIAAEKGVSASGIAVAWILRHPAKMQVVIGTVNTERVRHCACGADCELSREEWYEIYLAAGNKIP